MFIVGFFITAMLTAIAAFFVVRNMGNVTTDSMDHDYTALFASLPVAENISE